MHSRLRSSLLVLALAVAGCSGSPASPSAQPQSSPTPSTAAAAPIGPTATAVPPAEAATPAPTPAPITVEDDAGRTVTLAAAPARIVSAAPSDTELAFAVGLGGAVVGVDKYSNYPAEAQSRTIIGSYAEPDLEGIIAAKPDLVLVTDIHVAQLVPELERLGIPTLVLAAKNLEGVLLDIELLGKVAGRETEAEGLVASLRTRIAAVETRVAGADPVPVFYELDPTLYTAGSGTFVDDIIRRAGGRNIAAGATTAYPQLSAEEVISANPSVIILADQVAGATAETVADRAGWSEIAAVADGRIIAIDPDIASRPGPRVVDALELIAAMLHPASAVTRPSTWTARSWPGTVALRAAA